MFKKSFLSFLALAMIFSANAVTATAADAAAVCGFDGQTYASAAAAGAAGVDVSYEFACVSPASESGLYEASSDVNFAGMLVEVGSTDVPTNLIIRDNKTQTDYTVSVTAATVLGQKKDQATSLVDWIPGDQIRVIGKKNANTGNVDASVLVNLSIKIGAASGVNGWITAIDKTTKTITYQWANKEHTFSYDDNTKFVSGLKNPASVDDLAVNDRIRGRLLLRAGQNPTAQIVVVLRRGAALFMKIRTFTPRVTLVRMDSTIAPTTLQVKIENTPGLKTNDVNNLIGTEGALVTVNVTESTVITRKYFGRTDLSELAIGDRLMVVGRVNDDGTVDAKLIKDESIWKTSTRGHAGEVTEVNVDENYLMLAWTPVKTLTRVKLKEKLNETDQNVSAQSLDADSLRNALKEKIKNFTAEKVGNLVRTIKQKKVQIARITHEAVKIGDLIERQPAKTVKVTVNSHTKIVVGTNTNASLSDIKAGDKVRVRGTMSANKKEVAADTIVVVNSLPEIDEPLDTPLDDVNEIVSIIETDGSENLVPEDASSVTEEEIISDNSDNSDAEEENDGADDSAPAEDEDQTL